MQENRRTFPAILLLRVLRRIQRVEILLDWFVEVLLDRFVELLLEWFVEVLIAFFLPLLGLCGLYFVKRLPL